MAHDDVFYKFGVPTKGYELISRTASQLTIFDQIDPSACRRWVAEHCDVNVVARAYESAYRTVLRSAVRQRQPASV